MPQPPTIFPKLHVSSRPPDSMSAPSALVAYSGFGSSQLAADASSHQQVFRTKRKHVLKACDRCRVKKTKCDGNQPCYRCASYNHPCLFRERKVTQTKAYSRGFVEMLESHHALVVKALQQLYTHCINNKCFPGEPIDSVDGSPLTHAILDRLGLIKEAEESSSDILDEEAIEASQYWRIHHRCGSSVESEDMSPTQTSPINLSPVSEPTSDSPISDTSGIAHQQSLTGLQEMYSSYGPYSCANSNVWPMTSAPTQVVDFTNTLTTPGYQTGNQYLNSSPNTPRQNAPAPNIPARNQSILPPGGCPQLIYSEQYPGLANFSYHASNDALVEAEQYPLVATSWNRIKGEPHIGLNCP